MSANLDRLLDEVRSTNKRLEEVSVEGVPVAELLDTGAITPSAAASLAVPPILGADEAGTSDDPRFGMRERKGRQETTTKHISNFFQSVQMRHLVFDDNIQHIVRVGQEHEMRMVNEETAQVCQYLLQAMALRDKYVYLPQLPEINDKVSSAVEFDPDAVQFPPASEWVFRMVNGVYEVYSSDDMMQRNVPFTYVPSAVDFFYDFKVLNKIISFGPVKSFSYARLKLLQAKRNLYMQLNEEKELVEMKGVPRRDFYNVRKVDTHIHHSAAMTQKHLLKFIKSKLRTEANVPVIQRDGRVLTLRQVFESINMSPHDLSVDTLDVHADKTTFHRFDRFNLKYNPFGVSRLREVFLKTDNFIKGRFLAELTHELIAELKLTKYQHAEYRLSIYGKSLDEWDKLAAWVVDFKLFSPHVRWMIQIPRLYSAHRGNNLVNSFEDFLRNIFQPLFEVTKDPSSHPKLHIFLQQLGGFDCVDDESKNDHRLPSPIPDPALWTSKHDPPYAYYLYYLYANLAWLNHFRHAREMTTFAFRPHSGEAGDIDHLAAAFLVAESINHGINLRQSPVLQYLYYLKQVGLAMSPLSNNSLFLDYQHNPFPTFFARGLNVSLSTDDPLQFHFTREPLIEEYSIAGQMWKLNTCDLCEIARNSCLQSGFEHHTKAYWLGERYYVPGPAGNDIYRTNVPNSRLGFRRALLDGELTLLDRCCHVVLPQHSLSSSGVPIHLALTPRTMQRAVLNSRSGLASVRRSPSASPTRSGRRDEVAVEPVPASPARRQWEHPVLARPESKARDLPLMAASPPAMSSMARENAMTRGESFRFPGSQGGRLDDVLLPAAMGDRPGEVVRGVVSSSGAVLIPSGAGASSSSSNASASNGQGEAGTGRRLKHLASTVAVRAQSSSANVAANDDDDEDELMMHGGFGHAHHHHHHGHSHDVGLERALNALVAQQADDASDAEGQSGGSRHDESDADPGELMGTP